MPTLVAASIAPRKAWSIHDSSGRSSSPTPKPSSIGVTTPTTATSVARPPTAIISLGVDSRPTWNKQEHRAELRQDGKRLARGEPGRVRSAEERRVPQSDADHQLSEHGRLAEPFDELARELRAHDHEGQGQQDGGHGLGAVAGPRGRQE